MPSPFDPISVFRELEDRHVAYVLIGPLAGVLRGTGETTREVIICPSTDERSLGRLAEALRALGVQPTAEEPTVGLDATDRGRHRFDSTCGALVLEPYPDGTNGWEDIRRRAERLQVDNALRIPVAATEDLLRILTARDLDSDRAVAARYRRLNELERSLDRGLSL
jgi:hypothetical protein